MTRIAVAGLVVIGLAFGIWILWSDGDPASDTATTIAAAPTTTTPVATPTTSLPAVTTTSLADGSHVVETVEEAEEILRELWFGWFEGIYNQDVDRIREVVATEDSVTQAIEQFAAMEFSREPHPDDIHFRDSEILRTDESCLAVWTALRLGGFREGETQNVHVLRLRDGHWVRLGLWVNTSDLWETDCDSVLSGS